MTPSEPMANRLQQFQADQALILNHVDDAIALLDSQQRLVLFNQKFVQMGDLDPQWLETKPTLGAIAQALIASGVWTGLQGEQILNQVNHPTGVTTALEMCQGNQIHVELSITATSDGGQLLIFRDVSLARQYQHQLAGEVQRLRFLLGLTERLQSSENLEEVGAFALRYLVEAMGAAFGDVKVITGEGENRRAGALTNLISGQFIATYGEAVVADMEAVLAQGVKYGEGLLWQVAETGQPIFVEDYSSHPQAVSGFRHPGIGQLGIFPIPSASGSIIGILTLESRSLQKLQEAPNQDMLLAACRTLGAAIERAQSQNRLQQINQDLEQVNQDLERASRLKSEFLASMSHELRTPLNSILGFSELVMRHQGQLTDRQVGHIKAINDSGRHLLDLINDILDLSKVEAGRVDLQLQPVSIRDLCRQCLNMIQPRADRKRLSLSLELDYSFHQVTLDERRVRQMIINLLSNAVKFTPEKGRIKLASFLAYGSDLLQDFRPDNSPVNASTPYLCIQVSDTGIGIPAEKQPLLFRPFQQVDASLTRRHDGTGLGLALTKRMAELHGGTVSLQSVCGEGSTFRIWLPLNDLRNGIATTGPGALPPPEMPAVAMAVEPSSLASRPRILVVEDHPYNQVLITEALEMEGFEVEIITDGQVMWERIETSPKVLPDVVLMDIQLPHVDGIQLIQAMRQRQPWRSVPILAVTAMAMAGDRDRCLAAGADDYVSKPLDFDELLQKVQAHLPQDKQPQVGVSPEGMSESL